MEESFKKRKKVSSGEISDRVKIRGKMLEGKGKIREADMPMEMQVHAMTWASKALDIYDVLDCSSIAAYIKKEFDKEYGWGWQCVVGPNFGGFFTYAKGTYAYFALEALNFLIFKVASA